MPPAFTWNPVQTPGCADQAESVLFAAGDATGFGPGPEVPITRDVRISVAVLTVCPLEDYAWVLRTAGDTWAGTFDAAWVKMSHPLPMGKNQPITLDVTWQGRVIHSEERTINVGPGCRDDDGDGICRHVSTGTRGWDCADSTPWVRPGLPELPGDGRDNDCDGVLAGEVDQDGDHYHPSVRAVPTSDQLATIRTIYAERPDLVERVLTAPPFEPDCDDTNPDFHPHAPEEGLGLDENCDGVPGDYQVRWWSDATNQPKGFPADDTTARDVARVTPDGRLQVRDQAMVWSSEPLDVPDWHAFDDGSGGLHRMSPEGGVSIRKVLRLRTGTGGVAWLVVSEEHDTGNFTTAFTGRIGWILVPRGSTGLVATRIDMGRRRTAMGEGPSSLVEVKRAENGIVVGRQEYRWVGDELVKVTPG